MEGLDNTNINGSSTGGLAINEEEDNDDVQLEKAPEGEDEQVETKLGNLAVNSIQDSIYLHEQNTHKKKQSVTEQLDSKPTRDENEIPVSIIQDADIN